MRRGKCPHRSAIYGKCDRTSGHEPPHWNKYSGVEWTERGGLTSPTEKTTTIWTVEHLQRAVHDRTGQRPIAWLAQVCLEDAQKEVPACDYTVDRPDLLDSERDSEVFENARTRIEAVLGAHP